MNAQSWRAGRKFACGALALGLIVNAPVLVAAAQAQTAIVDPNAAAANASAHDAAHFRRAARATTSPSLDLSKKAASEGHPLDADQVDFISGKAAQQQAANADAAAIKAKQEQAAATARRRISSPPLSERLRRALQAAGPRVRQADPHRHVPRLASTPAPPPATGNEQPRRTKRVTWRRIGKNCPGSTARRFRAPDRWRWRKSDPTYGKVRWSAWRDLNPRPLGPQTSALPGCATLRQRAPYRGRPGARQSGIPTKSSGVRLRRLRQSPLRPPGR